MATAVREITLLLLRHGERADEAFGFRGVESRSTKDRLDPLLTELGHQQATEAFERIVPFLRNKKPLIFVSPLKRTMATAAMVGMHEEINVSGRAAIPLIVMNGLCDCAAHVQLAGGANSAVRHGYIDGAVMESNDCTMGSPLMKMLLEIPGLQNLKRPIQYYKEQAGEMIAISEPVGAEAIQTGSSVQLGDSTSTAMSLITKSIEVASLDGRSRNKDLFTLTMERIVRIAAARECDTCVVVTHREGIRDLAASVTSGHRGYSTPYCCIGKFTVRVNEDGIDTGWRFDGVVPYEDF